MRSFLIACVLGSASCALLQPTPTKNAETEPALVEVSGRPSWVGLTAFAISSTVAPMIGAVGVETLDAADPCWSSGVLLAAVRNRAIAELAKVLDVAPDSEAAIATMKGAEVKLGWYDGNRTVYALATFPHDAPASGKPLSPHAPTGGVPILTLTTVLKDAARAHLDQTGACRDPYKRLDVKCCGGPATFCSDPTRYSRGLPAGKCACGDGPPCHQDFVCEERQGQKKCICRAKTCPCEVRNCTVGQTCGDGRCY